jgi:hypothetical protein
VQPVGKALPESSPDDTWMSVSTTRPHCMSSGRADRGVEGEVLHGGRVLAVDPAGRHGVVDRLDGVLAGGDLDLAGDLRAADVDEPLGERGALGEVVSILAVKGLSRSAWWSKLAAVGHGAAPSSIQMLCQCERNRRPPLSA